MSAAITLYYGTEMDPNYNTIISDEHLGGLYDYLMNYYSYSTLEDYNFERTSTLEATLTCDLSVVLSNFHGTFEQDNAINGVGNWWTGFNYCFVKGLDETGGEQSEQYWFITRAEIKCSNIIRYTLKLDVGRIIDKRLQASKLLDEQNKILIDRGHLDRFYYITNTEGDSEIKYNFALPELRTTETPINFNDRLELSHKRLFSQRSFLLIQCTNNGMNEETKTKVKGGIQLPYCTIIAPLSPMSITIGDLTTTWSAEGVYNAIQWGNIKVYYEDMTTGRHYEMNVTSISVVNLPLVTENIVVNSRTKVEDFLPYENEFLKSNVVLVTDNKGGDTYIASYALAVDEFKKLFDVGTIESDDIISVMNGYNNLNTLENFQPKNLYKNVLYLRDEYNLELKSMAYPFTSYNFISYAKEFEDDNVFRIFDSANVSTTPNKRNRVINLYHYMTFGNGATQDLIAYGVTTPTYGYQTLYGVGDIVTQGDSLPIANSTYAEYLRNQQVANTTAATIGVVGSALSAAVGLTTANPVALVGATIGAGQSVFGSVQKFESAKNGKATISNPSNNLIFNLQFDNVQQYGYIIKSIKDADMTTLLDYFYYKGYAINKYMTFKSIAFTRSLFNFIQSRDPNIKRIFMTSIRVEGAKFDGSGEEIASEILKIFENGFEYWHTRLYEYYCANGTMYKNVGFSSLFKTRGVYENIEEGVVDLCERWPIN